MMREVANDRISDLPDSILHYIISFLDIKNGARSSVLSKRWNYIWTTVPTLVFEYEDCDTSSYETKKFMDFVDGTLIRNKLSNLSKFTLSWNRHLSEFRVHNWISSVTRGNVKELTLYLRQENPLFIPPSLFTCQSLTSLQLLTSPSIRLPKHIALPRLKRLGLCDFEFSDESWNEDLFLNSPVLEELILDYCKFNIRNFCISIPTLKILRISNGIVDQNDLRDCVLKIEAPELVTLSFMGYVAKEFVLSSFQALVEASVCFHFQENVGAEAKHQLLGALAHVKCLTVYNETLQAICSAYHLSNNLLTFHNVKMLCIYSILTTDQGLIALLKAVPNLESLVFVRHMSDALEDNDENNESCSDGDDSDNAEGDDNHDSEDEGDVADIAEHRSNDECEDNNDSENESWPLNILHTRCLFTHLKSVCFQQFVGNRREMKWVRLILRYAKVLQIMDICCCKYTCARSEKELMVEIPSFPRASPGCVIKF